MKYGYRCTKCKEFFFVRKSLAEYERVELCECGATASRSLHGQVISVDVNLGYFDTNLNMMIESTGHRRQVLKEQGLVPVSKGYDVAKHARQRMAVKKTENRAKAKKAITNAVLS